MLFVEDSFIVSVIKALFHLYLNVTQYKVMSFSCIHEIITFSYINFKAPFWHISFRTFQDIHSSRRIEPKSYFKLVTQCYFSKSIIKFAVLLVKL